MNRTSELFSTATNNSTSGDQRRGKVVPVLGKQQHRAILHDLKLPMTVIKGELEAIEDGIHRWSPDVVSSMLSELAQIDSLLCAIDTPESKQQHHPLCLSRLLCSELLRFDTVTQQAGLNLLSSIQPDLPIYAATQPLKRILQNLFSNSVKYTDRGGCICVTLRAQPANQYCELVWQDSSPGVTSNELPFLATANYRTTSAVNTHQGQGMGLWSVKKITEQLNASIDFNQSDLGGLKISIRFPTQGA